MIPDASGEARSTEGWEEYLEASFPGFLLPDAERHALGLQQAKTFLRRLTLPSQHLETLCGISLVSARLAELEEFCLRQLPALVRVLPSRTKIAHRYWRSGFVGRLDVRRTLAQRCQGDATTFVTRSRSRVFDLPETILLRDVADRLRELLVSGRTGRLLGEMRWATTIVRCEGALRSCLNASVLREVPGEPIGGRHLRAAANARHPCYNLAAQWHIWLRDALDRPDPTTVARVLADGALRPVSTAKRFEIAVLIRLIATLHEHLRATDDNWELRAATIRGDRDEVAVFDGGQRGKLSVYYDQAVLPLDGSLGLRDRAVRHYLAQSGRLRPDITVILERDNSFVRAIVFEIKLSESAGYLVSGLEESLLYAQEYGDWLTGWPKAVLVTSGAQPLGVQSRDLPVVAASWGGWLQASTIAALIA